MKKLHALWDSFDGTSRVILVFLFCTIGIVPFAFWAVKAEQKEWEAFALKYECKIVGKISGSSQTGIGYGMTANGQYGSVITITDVPSKTGYLCNDGVTYWR